MTDLLLVTTDKELRRFVKDALEGVAVRFLDDFSSGHKAMEAFREHRPKLMLVDLFLPENNGIDVLKTIKKLDDTVTVILLSRVQTRLLKERAFRTGADDVVIYPCEPAMIIETVRHRLDNLKEAEVHFN